jgi:hypothetical protein
MLFWGSKSTLKINELANSLLFLFLNLPNINFSKVQSLFALFYSTFQWLVMSRAFSQEAVPSGNNYKNTQPSGKLTPHNKTTEV